MPPFQSSSCTATTGCFSISCGTGGSTGPCRSACHSGSRGLQDQHATRKPFLPFTFMGHAHVPAQSSPRTALYGVATSGEQEPLCSVHNPLPCTIPVSHRHLHPSFSAQDSLGPERCLCCSPACRGRGPTPAPHVQERERERRESSTVPSASFFLPLEIAEKEETCQKTH